MCETNRGRRTAPADAGISINETHRVGHANGPKGRLADIFHDPGPCIRSRTVHNDSGVGARAAIHRGHISNNPTRRGRARRARRGGACAPPPASDRESSRRAFEVSIISLSPITDDAYGGLCPSGIESAKKAPLSHIRCVRVTSWSGVASSQTTKPPLTEYHAYVEFAG